MDLRWSQLAARHSQNMSEAASSRSHWGYMDEPVPCAGDKPTCEYLDLVYNSHDQSVLYVGILWVLIGAIFLAWAVGRQAFSPPSDANIISTALLEGDSDARTTDRGFFYRLRHAATSFTNRYLLRDCIRPIFGQTTRLQVLILAVLAAYLLVFSFVGMIYRTWFTPVKNMPGVYRTRTTLGPWSDRVGLFAYALTPLSVLFASRESVLSLLTGVPYQNFNFLHRWVGYIIVAQSTLHTIGWLIIELHLYQPQPQVWLDLMSNLYILWGWAAICLLLALYILSLPPVIRLTGYEFFRKSHYVLAMVYIGACIGHWKELEAFMIPSLVIWFLDRIVRGIRTALIHYNFIEGNSRMGFSAAQAATTIFPDPENGDVVRLDFFHPHDPWEIGQHFYLCFTESSIWQSHPFTPLNIPVSDSGRTKHSYIFRAKGGETKKIIDIARRKIDSHESAVVPTTENNNAAPTVSVVLTGPYGDPILRNITSDVNVLCVAGGTGVTYVLPAIMSFKKGFVGRAKTSRKLELVWIVRHLRDAQWIRSELDVLAAEEGPEVVVRILATRDAGGSSSSREPSESDSPSHSAETTAEKECQAVAQPIGGHPDVGTIVRQFVDETISGRTAVFASGPGGLMSKIRTAVADCNEAGRVWNGQERYDVSLIYDERMER
ncbi:ferric reductase like transmembrane component [Colletotrichum graminicola]|uniref:Ferric reductase like transmembrane component n=1 Tax=Colletotrichum graminicola (strain M1.001 / M2 / FGSC 10212) TaxID=645133 RepID=E3QPU8_COLGM|nr:ferric reductase like transmembrane component [Colletotrichum graminicola M1.001]EFQ32875.1 ferric reductase like transmembrane component [Colletotrichum graminicola M1.001]WDK16523.1 ferric reductase like transmembrane component [Colletotrichum graminicola]